MALEYRINITEPGWLDRNVETVRGAICRLATFVGERDAGEFWLKDRGANSGWDFDARVFIDQGSIFVEISSKTCVLRDVGVLYESIASEVATMLEDDGEPVDPREVFALGESK